MLIKLRSLCLCVLPWVVLSSTSSLATPSESGNQSICQNFELVQKVHSDSSALRLSNLRTAVGRETLWPAPGEKAWGDIMWALSLLYLNERVDDANARILELANTKEPFAYFGSVDYVRILALFNSRSPFFSGRLSAQTESAMKRVLWGWVDEFENYQNEVTGLYRKTAGDHPLVSAENPVWVIYASENHDLIRKTGNYITLSVLKDDPEYQNRKIANGKTVTEAYEYYNNYFKEWLKERATRGLWMETGAGYAKYSYAAIFNLHDLSPDPELRELAKMFLDIAFVEEAQISFSNAYRGGGMSRLARSDPETGGIMVTHTNLLHGKRGGRSTHSRSIETSEYQVPETAIYLREYGDQEAPFVIKNRMLGESAGPNLGQGTYRGKFHGATFLIDPDSPIVNYSYRTPEYIIGGAMQDPNGNDSGITRQDRWSGILFNDSKQSKVTPWADSEPGKGPRVHNAYWNVQHENLMISQKTQNTKYMDRLMVYFSPDLEKSEEDGWVFVSNGTAFAAVKAIGGYAWGESATRWRGVQFLIPQQEYAPILFLAGGPSDGFNSLKEFQSYVLNDVEINVSGTEITCKRPGKPTIQYFTDHRLAMIDGIRTDLNMPSTYSSPYLNANPADGIVTTQWKGLKTVYNFQNVTTSTIKDENLK